uniref:Uncharacterized protein n=1 Tax=Eutreptiella gymnastica TaxID=73025 RepID=A0A7S1JI87_9EUGL
MALLRRIPPCRIHIGKAVTADDTRWWQMQVTEVVRRNPQLGPHSSVDNLTGIGKNLVGRMVSKGYTEIEQVASMSDDALHELLRESKDFHYIPAAREQARVFMKYYSERNNQNIRHRALAGRGP